MAEALVRLCECVDLPKTATDDWPRCPGVLRYYPETHRRACDCGAHVIASSEFAS